MKYILRYVFVIAILSACCGWSQNVPPNIMATGDQSYCPGTQIRITTSFDIIDPDDTRIEAFFIQISEGYTFDEDILLLAGNHPNIVREWDANQAKLSFFSAIASATMSYTDLVAAVRDVVYVGSPNSRPVDKVFSFTIGNANYLPSTGHYYEYVPSLGITWTSARAAADARTYFGLKGYLATITTPEEAQLSGEQAEGAGWIGGSDEQTEGVWRWMTGPEAGTIFWNGGINGTTPNYANWNANEPNDCCSPATGDENYAHVTGPNIGNLGSWNDLPNAGDTNPSSPYHPQGYIVEYGGTPGDPVIDISASTRITIPQVTGVATPPATCGPGSFTLDAIVSNGDVAWFDSPTATVPVFTGTPFTTPILSTTNTFYAMAFSNGCYSGDRVAVVAQVNPIPNIVSTSETTICLGESGLLGANASAGAVNWYTQPTGGAAIANGNVFNTPVLTTTTTYYVDATANGCTTPTRTPVAITVQQTSAPTGIGLQEFCDIENANLNDITVTGTNIRWYTSLTGDAQISSSAVLQNNTRYYASQTLLDCESEDRLEVLVIIYETVIPLQPSEIDVMETCDSDFDGDETNGFAMFDLTLYESVLLNGSDVEDFNFHYFTDVARLIPINTAPESFENTVANEQTIYVRIEHNTNVSCYTDVSFNIKVNALPNVQLAVTFQNCDEDENPDGFTNFNLNELDDIITDESATAFNITYHASLNDADMAIAPLNPLPYNNQTSNTIYGRVENAATGCYAVAAITLDVSTTSISPNFIVELETCDDDDAPDGLQSFDLSAVSIDFINQFPTGQNLTVRFFKNLSDAQLEENEILNPINYTNQTPFSETLYVRVESEDNGDCFGIGPNLVLTVHPLPEFEVDQSETFCLNGGSISLNTFNPGGVYNYIWSDSNNTVISTNEFATVASEGIYTVTAFSNQGCQSTPITFQVTSSGISTITEADIIVTDLSNNNTITISIANIGIGDYEFALDNEFGTFQDNPVFQNVFAGEHTVYVRDKNGCGVVDVQVFVMGFPKFFTPNGDGANDTWNIKGLSNEYLQNTTVFIYDRYGKLIKQLKPFAKGWNGTFNGQLLTTNDYWYVVNLVDDTGNTRIFKGHFSLIR